MLFINVFKDFEGDGIFWAYSEDDSELVASLTIEDEETGLSTSKRGDSESSLSWKTRKLVVGSCMYYISLCT